MEQLLEMSTPWKIGGVLLVLALIISAIITVNFSYAFARGIIQHRRKCRIAGLLLGNGLEFEGNITILGVNGVRFQPINQTTGGRLQDLMASEGFVEFNLKIGSKIFPVFVDGYHNFFSPLYFLEAISRGELAAILTESKIKPVIVPNIGHKTTRKKWKLQIEERKQRIGTIKNARRL